MAGTCVCASRTRRPAWPLVLILALAPCRSNCLESPAAAKVNPRGNHWAVGHLMGKKSIDSLPEVEDTISDYLKAPEGTRIMTDLDPGQSRGLIETLLQQKKQKSAMLPTANRLFGLRSGWREEDRDKYRREMSHLLLLPSNGQDKDST